MIAKSTTICRNLPMTKSCTIKHQQVAVQKEDGHMVTRSRLNWVRQMKYVSRIFNEISTVPIYYLAKPQPRERAWHNQRGKKTLFSLSLVPIPVFP